MSIVCDVSAPMNVKMCVCVCVGIVPICIFESSCLATKVLIGKNLPTRRLVVSGGWGNESGAATAYKFVT